MRGTCAPKDPAIEESADGDLSPRSDRHIPPIFGLSVVSGLNIACLAFMTYHFTTHPPDQVILPVEHSAASEVSDALVQTTDSVTLGSGPDVRGNVDLASANKKVISIASGFSMLDGGLIDRRENVSQTLSMSYESAEDKAKDTNESLSHWVQLGALSKKTTAHRYWSGLKLRHQLLLHDREVRYFGPEEIDGSLYHVRLGPMTGEAATELCEKLKTEGADCFCISPQKSGV